MFKPKGESNGKLIKQLNKYGKFFYSMILDDFDPAVEFFLFSKDQYWGGFTDNSKSGTFMYKELEDEDLKVFGTWRKQEDGSIIILGNISNQKFGFVGIIHDTYIELFEAEASNSLEKKLLE